MTFPHATKVRPPKSGWESHCAEYIVEGEPNRFRYCQFGSFDTTQPPPTLDTRTIFATVGPQRKAVALFAEIPAGVWGRKRGNIQTIPG